MELNSALFWHKLLMQVSVANSLNSGNVPEHLQQILKKEFPDETVRIYPFGSRILGVGQKNSDLDIYVEIGNTFSQYSDGRDLIRQKRIANAIKSNPDWTFNVCYGGKCPIVKAVFWPNNLDCDISCSSGITYSQNVFVKYIFELQPIARYMVIYLREWVKHHGMQEKFRSHIIILMVIYYLQIYNFLPGIQKFQENLQPTIGPWVAAFNRLKLSSFQMTEIAANEEQTRKMLKQFFQYYSTFNFTQFAVCPYLGTQAPRSTFSKLMPKRYFNPGFQMAFAFIQDFLILNDNKGEKIGSYHIDCFKEACRRMVTSY